MTTLTLLLTLSAFVEKSVSRDPAVAAARASAEQAVLLRREVSAAALPRLSAKASYTRSDDPLFVFGAILEERSVEASHFGLGFLREPGYRTRTTAGLEAGVPLFTGFQLTSARRRTALGADAAAAALRATAEDRRRVAVDAWLEARAAAARAAVLAERAASAGAMLDESKNLVKSGLVLGSDFHAASALLAKLKGQSVLETRRLEGAKGRMAVLAGEASEPAGGLGGLPPPLEDSAALAGSAAASRGDLEAGRLAASVAEEGARAASRSLLPRVEGFASVQDSGRGFLDGGTSRLVGLRAEMPFGDPAYTSRRDAARAGASRAAAAARAAEQDAAASLAFGRAAYAGAVEAFPLFVQARDEARRSLELFRPLYRQGRQSVLEVLRAEDALAQAEFAVIDARKGIASAWAGLRQGAGRLDAEAVAALEAALEAQP